LYIDKPRQCIGAVPGSLGPAQNFDCLYVEQGRNGADTAKIDVIDQETDRGIGCSLVLLQLSDTANLQITCPVTVARPVEIWHDIDELLEMLHSEFFDDSSIKYRDAGGYFASRSYPEIGRDDDFVDRFRGKQRA